EQRLFRRLAVFPGGCTLQGVAAVCDAGGDLSLDVLNGLTTLVEQSLLWIDESRPGAPRYRMLETIREYAAEELEASGEAEGLRHRLAQQALPLALAAMGLDMDFPTLRAIVSLPPKERPPLPAFDFSWLDVELDTLRAILSWCVAREELEL